MDFSKTSEMPKRKNLWTVLSSTKLCVFTLIVVLFFIYSVLFLFTDSHNSYRGIFLSPLPVQQEKLVIWWTPYFDRYTNFPQNLSGLGCGFDKCIFTYNRSLASKSDAVIFHWRDINPKDLPPKDPYWTKWVLYNYESPPHTYKSTIESVISRINWVVTYRLDSDIVAPYGDIRLHEKTDINWNDIGLSPKSFKERKSVAWLVSNCNTESHRERYVQSLKKHIPVSIYGRCGSRLPSCTNRPADYCYGVLAKNYKFYLSFENSLYLDYVTEKAFIPLKVGMVPIVFGGANYSRVLPPNSFINAMDFHTPKDLADYLRTVETNLTLYKSYHEWRKEYSVIYATPKYYWLCDLCQFLHEDYYSNNNQKIQNKTGFYDWWYKENVLSERNFSFSF